MSKITHKEAKKILEIIISAFFKNTEYEAKVYDYIKQQEKKDKLLDKYREFMKNEKHPDSENYELIDEIKELERRNERN